MLWPYSVSLPSPISSSYPTFSMSFFQFQLSQTEPNGPNANIESTSTLTERSPPPSIPSTSVAKGQVIGIRAPRNVSRPGSFEHNSKLAEFNMKWSSIEEFTAWLQREEHNKCIELKINTKKFSDDGNFVEKHRYVCSRQGTGGIKQVARKTEQKYNIESKHTGCTCVLIIKLYPDTLIVLGKYTDSHSHPTGNGNLKFTRLSEATKRNIANMLEMCIETTHIVSLNCDTLLIKH